jgi:hypothetical protein
MSERIERLQAEAARLNVARAGRRDGLWQAVGAVAMVAGVVLAFVAYQVSLGKDDSRDIDSLLILAVAMLALAVVGGAVFLRYSLGRFLRFWLLRQLLEGQAHIDAVVAAVAPTAAAPATNSSTAPAADGAAEQAAPGRVVSPD